MGIRASDGRKIWLTPLKVTGIAILTVLFIIFFIAYTTSLKDYATAKLNIRAEAVYVDCQAVSSMRGMDNYALVYKYIDENGIEYTGYGNNGLFRNPDEASKHYGETVEIYIDGKGHSLCTGGKYDLPNRNYILPAVLGALIVIYIILVFILPKIVQGKRKQKEPD